MKAIKANELRIGSWYNSTKFNQPIMLAAEDIHEMVSRAEGANIECYIEEIVQPIQLTEQWLKDFGVQNIKYPKWIKAVHEFQNWYYYKFEKKELTLKDNE